MDVCCVQVRVARHDIGLLCSLMAGYEGVAIVRTMDPREGVVELLAAPAFYQVLLDILQGLSAEMTLSLLAEDADTHPRCPGTDEEPSSPHPAGH
ncbi:MAG: DUF4911 domain-containing protein [Candidatus Tectomicrobia bacterium]|uniref:DUF4911 domain-containing protein n=1 Tax=Tectimicrobiota bacterium TaxID=2528274 RepID=A0A937W6G6_UNCTE|nr:DUF4911 domain-containing protein [Candidatus Tectomicrobia bacterium]